MSGWAIAFFVLYAWHLATGFVSGRLIYWQRRHIAALNEGARLDALLSKDQP